MAEPLRETPRPISKTPLVGLGITIGKQRRTTPSIDTSPSPWNDWSQQQAAFSQLSPTRSTTKRIMTARDVYASAEYPALVPDPLRLQGETRQYSAPAALETHQSNESPPQTPQTAFLSTPSGSPTTTNKEERPQRSISMNMVAEWIASGIDAEKVAVCLELDFQDMVKQLAVTALESLEAGTMTPILVRNNIEEGESDSHPDRESPAPVHEQGESLWEEVRLSLSTGIPRSTSLDNEQEAVFHDAVDTHHRVQSTTCFRTVAGFEAAQERYMEEFLNAQQQPPPPVTTCAIFEKLLFVFLSIMAILLCRILGIWVSESQKTLTTEGPAWLIISLSVTLTIVLLVLTGVYYHTGKRYLLWLEISIRILVHVLIDWGLGYMLPFWATYPLVWLLQQDLISYRAALTGLAARPLAREALYFCFGTISLAKIYRRFR